MNLPGKPSFSRTLAVVLIVCALVGTEFSYHLTLESRFDVIEQRLQQNTVALQQFQDSLDSITSAKTDTLTGLNKQVEALQSSFGPLGKATRDQTDTLSQLHQQIVTMQQAQTDELDAQKKLFGSIDQLERERIAARKEATTAAAIAAVPAPVAVAPAPVTAPVVATPAPAQVVVTPPAAVPAPVAAPVAAPAPETTDASAPTHTAVKPHAVGAASASLRPTAGNQDSVDLRSDQGDTDLPSPGMMAAHQDDATESDSFKSVRALPVSLSEGR